MTGYDPRVTAARPDLAAQHLKGRVAASRFVEGKVLEIVDPQTPVRRTASPDALLETEALLGERVTIYEMTDEGWAWGQLSADGYVGFLPANALAPPGPSATHKITALRTLVFPGPSIKEPPLAALPLGGRLAVTRIAGPFAVTATGGYIPARHLAPIDAFEPDFVAVAERFLGVPYLWGGKTSLGLDCSGLLQIALTACGIAAPRDTDMQEQAIGTAIVPDAAFSNLRRGDLVFWRGHVAIARDHASFVHANAFHMAVAYESIIEAIARIGATGSDVTTVKRIAGNTGPACPPVQ
jgi:cell wall-associated NlpC family hydrolase